MTFRLGRDANDLGDGAAQEEVVGRDLVDLAHAAEQLEQPSHLTFLHAKGLADVAHARRAETLGTTERWPNAPPQPFVGRREPDLMPRQPHPGAIERDIACAR